MASGCIHRDERDIPCMAPVADRKSRMCARHAAHSKGFLTKFKQNMGNELASSETLRRGKQTNLKSVDELERWIKPPRVWRTTMCETVIAGRHCIYGHTCNFAHVKEQLRHLDDPFPSIVYVPRKGAGEVPPPPPQPAPMPAAPLSMQEQLQLVDPAVKHPLWNVPCEDIEPEQCTICYEDDKFADRRWKPCGHMVCSECMANWRSQSITKKVNGTRCHLCRSVVIDNETLPKAEQRNQRLRKKPVRNVWGDPEAKAQMAQSVFGSQLTVEEERAQEAALRMRLKEQHEEEEFIRGLEAAAQAEETRADQEAKLMAQKQEEEIQRLLNSTAPPTKPQSSAVARSKTESTPFPPQSAFLQPFPTQQPYFGAFSAQPNIAPISTSFPSPPPTSFPPPPQTFSPPAPGMGFATTPTHAANNGKKSPPPGFQSPAAAKPAVEEDLLMSIKLQNKQKLRKARELVLSRANEQTATTAVAQADNDTGLSQWEYEQAELEMKRREQEEQDFLLAQKLANELNVVGAAAGAPMPTQKRGPNDKWECALCTFENGALFPVCAMCETPRGN